MGSIFCCFLDSVMEGRPHRRAIDRGGDTEKVTGESSAGQSWGPEFASFYSDENLDFLAFQQINFACKLSVLTIAHI